MIMIVITCVNSQLTFLHTAWSKYWKKKSNIWISELSKNFQTKNTLLLMCLTVKQSNYVWQFLLPNWTMRQIDYFKTYWLVSPQTYIKDQCCLQQKLYVWFYQSSTTEIPWDTMHAHGWSFYSSNRHLVAWLVFNWVFSPSIYIW